MSPCSKLKLRAHVFTLRTFWKRGFTALITGPSVPQKSHAVGKAEPEEEEGESRVLEEEGRVGSLRKREWDARHTRILHREA